MIESNRVLIADDDPPTRMLLRAAITQWGYEGVEAKDGEEAWESLQGDNPPRILIVDWLMPKLDGLALCSRIQQKLHSRPYIILLTQLTGTPNIIKALEAGANEFLSKPFNMVELRSRLAVGTKIINYENILLKQNHQKQTYIEQMSTLGNLTSTLLKKLNQSKQSEELRADLIKMTKIIENYQASSRKQGDL